MEFHYFKVLIDSIYSISHVASFETSLHNAPSEITRLECLLFLLFVFYGKLL